MMVYGERKIIDVLWEMKPRPTEVPQLTWVAPECHSFHEVEEKPHSVFDRGRACVSEVRLAAEGLPVLGGRR